MKNTIFLLLTIVMIICTSCNISNSDSEAIREIEETVEKVNDSCPVKFTESVVLTSVKYRNNTITYRYKLRHITDEAVTAMEKFKTGMAYMIKAEAESSPESKKFFENIIKVDAKLVYYYYTDDGDSFSMEYTSADIRKVLNSH